jgi:hypothetical protein
MYFVEMRPWLVGMPLKPPEVCGRLPAKPGVLADALAWGDPTPARALPVDRELPACDPAKAFLCCSGSEKPWPSWSVTTRIPGFGVTTGACESSSEAAAKRSCQLRDTYIDRYENVVYGWYWVCGRAGTDVAVDDGAGL